MIPLALDDVAVLCPGRLERVRVAKVATGVQIDSRRVSKGDLFVAVGGGEAFAEDPIAHGAAATLVPEDAFAALAALGRAVRDRSPAKIVAITGSTGKTSTKDILAAMCAPRRRTVAAEASYNNELGVPLTLCRLEPDTEVCILELAMRGLGEIAALAAVARPHVAVVTNVGPAHLELVGSIEAVAQAKGELIDALPPGGAAIVPESFRAERDDIEVVRVGDPDAVTEDGTMRLHFGGGDVVFSFRARHQARNALTALHAARVLGLEVEGRVDVVFSRWRGDELPLRGGGVLVNDCYNANPISMRAALEDLVERSEGRSRAVAVLGEMAELGAESGAYHREIGELAGELGVGVLLAVGDLGREYLAAATTVPVTAWTPTAGDAVRAAEQLVEPGDCVLVKGSRVVGLEIVAAALADIRV